MTHAHFLSIYKHLNLRAWGNAPPHGAHSRALREEGWQAGGALGQDALVCKHPHCKDPEIGPDGVLAGSCLLPQASRCGIPLCPGGRGGGGQPAHQQELGAGAALLGLHAPSLYEAQGRRQA